MDRRLRRVWAVVRAANPAQENYLFGFVVMTSDDKITLETFWEKQDSNEFEIRQFKVEPKCLAALISQGLVMQEKSYGKGPVTFWFTGDAFERLGE